MIDTPLQERVRPPEPPLPSSDLVQRTDAIDVEEAVEPLLERVGPGTELALPPGPRRPSIAQAITLAAKVRALLDGRFNVSVDDIKQVSRPSLRHRLILNFEGEAEETKTDDIIKEIIEKTTVEAN
jgi:MoxR-like ATPase